MSLFTLFLYDTDIVVVCTIEVRVVTQIQIRLIARIKKHRFLE